MTEVLSNVTQKSEGFTACYIFTLFLVASENAMDACRQPSFSSPGRIARVDHM